MKRILSFILAGAIATSAFLGIDIVKAANTVGFDLSVERTLDYTLVEGAKTNEFANDAYLYWNIDMIDGSPVTTSEYDLTYNPQDNRRVNLEMERINDDISITLKSLVGPAYTDMVDRSYTTLRVYYNGSWIAPTPLNYPYLNGSGIVYSGNAPANKDTDNGIRVNLKQGAGIIISYGNEIIKMQWDGSYFKYTTNSVSNGKIVDFNLKAAVLGAGVPSTDHTISAFQGVSGIKSIPTADNRLGAGNISIDPVTGNMTIYDDWSILNKIANTNVPNPSENPGLVFSFDLPKKWSDTENKYVPITTAEAANFMAVADITSSLAGERFSISANPLPTNTTSVEAVLTDAKVVDKAELVQDFIADGRVYFEVQNLPSGIIYDASTITVTKNNDMNFRTKLTNIEKGVVYTFLEYSIVAASPTEYYLRITPYARTAGYYTVYTGTSQSVLSQWARVDEKTGLVSIEIPIKPSLSGSWYRVDFTLVSPSGQVTAESIVLKSQVLGIKPDNAFLELPTPKNLEVIPTIVETGDTSDLILEISFDLGHKSVFDALISREIDTVYYDFFHAFLNDENYNDPFGRFAVDITKLIHDATDAVTHIQYGDPSSELVKSIIETRQESIGEMGYEDFYRVKLTYKLPAYDLNAEQGVHPFDISQYDFVFPNIYKIWTIGHYTDKYFDGVDYVEEDKETFTGRSNIVNITLDSKSNVEVPPPQNLRIHDENPHETTMESYAISFNTIRETLLSDYKKLMLEPKNLILDSDSIEFNYYMSQSKGKMDSLKANIDAEVKGTALPNPSLKVWTATVAVAPPIPYEFDMETIMVTDGSTTKSAISALRQGDIIKLAYILEDMSADRQIYEITGLDDNQTYYSGVNTVIIPYDNTDPDNPVRLPLNDENVRQSKLSTIVTETTLKEPETPTTDEKTPPTPINFKVIDEGDGFVKLYWDKIIEAKNEENEDEEIEYQLFKIVASPADAASLLLKEVFSTFYGKQPNSFVKEGFQTDDADIYLYSGGSFTTISPDTKYVYDSLTDINGNMLTDKTLYPNKIHYYYLRAVRINTVTGEKVYSEWTPLTYTSNPIKQPLNLEVLRENVTYDKYSEIFIGFDAPISDLTKLGTDVDIEYQIKADDEDWQAPVTMNVSELRANATASSLLGYTYFKYKIDGLKSGTMYYIRVRMVDKAFGDESLYSNTVSHRTNSDQDDVNKEDQVNKWEQIFDQETAKIYKRPYWVLRDTNTELAILYRNDFKQQELQNAISGMYTLGDNTNRNKTMYIPAEFLTYANETGKGFQAVNEIVSVMLPNKFVSAEQTQAIKDAINIINDKKAVDYALKITVNQTVYTGSINGENPASPRIELIVSVVTLKEAEKSLSRDFEEKYNSMLISDDIRHELRLELSEMIDDNESAEKITLFIKDFAGDFANDLATYMRNRLTRVIRDEINVSSFSNAVTIVASVDTSLAVSGYTYTTAWIKKETSDFAGKKVIYTTVNGLFIFAGYTLNIPGLTGIAGGDNFKKMYEKYGFDEFFGKDYINTNANVTGRMVYGTLARLAGAPKGTDYSAFLRQKGVTALASKMDKALTQEETIYAIMMAYEIKTGTKVNSVKITNYNVLQGINVSEAYKRHIMVGVQLGIVDKAVLKPKESLSTLEYMKMLSRLSTKVNF